MTDMTCRQPEGDIHFTPTLFWIAVFALIASLFSSGCDTRLRLRVESRPADVTDADLAAEWTRWAVEQSRTNRIRRLHAPDAYVLGFADACKLMAEHDPPKRDEEEEGEP